MSTRQDKQIRLKVRAPKKNDAHGEVTMGEEDDL